MKSNKKLQQGEYMNVNNVQHYVKNIICSTALSRMITNICKVYELNNISFYKTKDLKSVMMPHTFREMECHVTTHMV